MHTTSRVEQSEYHGRTATLRVQSLPPDCDLEAKIQVMVLSSRLPVLCCLADYTCLRLSTTASRCLHLSQAFGNRHLFLSFSHDFLIHPTTIFFFISFPPVYPPVTFYSPSSTSPFFTESANNFPLKTFSYISIK